MMIPVVVAALSLAPAYVLGQSVQIGDGNVQLFVEEEGPLDDLRNGAGKPFLLAFR